MPYYSTHVLQRKCANNIQIEKRNIIRKIIFKNMKYIPFNICDLIAKYTAYISLDEYRLSMHDHLISPHYCYH